MQPLNTKQKAFDNEEHVSWKHGEVVRGRICFSVFLDSACSQNGHFEPNAVSEARVNRFKGFLALCVQEPRVHCDCGVQF